MNSTQESSITWTVVDSEPIARIDISRDLSFDELRELGRAIYATLAAMAWNSAVLLEVGSRSRGDRVMHLLRKAEYEADHSAAALCGKPGPWEFVEVLRTASGKGGICKKCLAMQEFAVSLHPEQEESEGGEHAE